MAVVSMISNPGTILQNLQVLGSRVALPAAFLGAFEFFVQALATSTALPRGAIGSRRVAVRAFVGRSFPTAIFALAVGATPTSAAVLILHLSGLSPLQGGVVNVNYSRRVDLVHNTIRRERERLCCKNRSHSPAYGKIYYSQESRGLLSKNTLDCGATGE
jgi:hypothetical protein